MKGDRFPGQKLRVERVVAAYNEIVVGIYDMHLNERQPFAVDHINALHLFLMRLARGIPLVVVILNGDVIVVDSRTANAKSAVCVCFYRDVFSLLTPLYPLDFGCQSTPEKYDY